MAEMGRFTWPSTLSTPTLSSRRPTSQPLSKRVRSCGGCAIPTLCACMPSWKPLICSQTATQQHTWCWTGWACTTPATGDLLLMLLLPSLVFATNFSCTAVAVAAAAAILAATLDAAIAGAAGATSVGATTSAGLLLLLLPLPSFCRNFCSHCCHMYSRCCCSTHSFSAFCSKLVLKAGDSHNTPLLTRGCCSGLKVDHQAACCGFPRAGCWRGSHA